MTRLADGDRGAFDEVYERTFHVVKAFAGRFMGSPNDSEDIAQQTLVKIFGQAQNYNRSSDALSWILTIASFECRTLRQKYRRKREDSLDLGGIETLASEQRSPEEVAILDDLKKCLLNTLDDLSVVDRESILISVTDGIRPEIPAATFRKRVQRGLYALKAAWRVEYE